MRSKRINEAFKNIIDISFQLTDFKLPITPIHNIFYQKYGTKEDLNLIIPISKHYEKCEAIWEQIKNFYFISPNEEYLNKLSIVFSIIENNGIKINEKEFSYHFQPVNYNNSIIFTVLLFIN